MLQNCYSEQPGQFLEQLWIVPLCRTPDYLFLLVFIRTRMIGCTKYLFSSSLFCLFYRVGSFACRLRHRTAPHRTALHHLAGKSNQMYPADDGKCKVTRVCDTGYPFPGLPIEQIVVVAHLCWLHSDGR